MKTTINLLRIAGKLLRWLAVAALLLGLLLLALVGPIDRTELGRQPFYRAMMAQLDTARITTSKKAPVAMAWAKVSITPGQSMPMAGYKPRDGFDGVRDTLYARMILFDVGGEKALLLNVDLLLFPPILKERLTSKLKEAGWGDVFLYLAATHTHNGIGGWDDSWAGRFVTGAYEEPWVEEMANRIVETTTQLQPVAGTIEYWEADASEWVENRIAFDKGKKDGKLRGVVMKRTDGKRGLFFTYSAHATSIPKTVRELSADYPGAVIAKAESDFDFGMYMAGMVGSHRFVWFPEEDGAYVPKVAGLIYDRIATRQTLQVGDSATFRVAHIPIQFGPSQLRLSEDLRLRDWAFRGLLHPLKGELTYLQLGDIVWIGTPCDFSGELFVGNSLDSLSEKMGRHVIITSFNGDYNGYITYDPHYDSLSKDEVRTMNWVGPHFGMYFSQMIARLLSRS